MGGGCFMPECYLTKRGINSSVTGRYIWGWGGVKIAIFSVTYFLNDPRATRAWASHFICYKIYSVYCHSG